MQSKYGARGLMPAAGNGRSDTARTLLLNGADVNAQTNAGEGGPIREDGNRQAKQA